MSGITSLVLFWSLATTQAGPLPPLESGDELNLPQWIEQLGSSEFRIRRSATRKLLGAGAAAKPMLQAAIASHNKEVRVRAEAILADLALGISPSTNVQLQRQLRLFRDGAANDRNAAFQYLIGALSLDELAELMESQPVAQRNTLVSMLFNNALAPAKFESPRAVLRFVAKIAAKDQRAELTASALTSTRMMQKWADDRQLDELKAIVDNMNVEVRPAFLRTLFLSSTAIRTFLENDQFPLLREWLKELPEDNDRVQALVRFTYDSRIITLLLEKKHWKEFLASIQQIKDANAREQLVQNLFNRTDTVKQLLEAEGLEFLMEMAKEIKNLNTRGQVLARLFANPAVQQQLAKEEKTDLPKLIAENEKDPKVRREYIRTLLQLIRYRSDVPAKLLTALWELIQKDTDVEWQVETVGYIVQSNLGQKVLRDKEATVWLLKLLETPQGQENGYNALRYLVQNSNNLNILLKHEQFDALWNLVRQTEGGERQNLLRYLFRSSTLMKVLKEQERTDWFVEIVEKEEDQQLKVSMLEAVFNNSTAINELIEKDMFERIETLVASVEPTPARARCFGAFLKHSSVLTKILEDSLESAMRYAQDDTDPEVRREFLTQALANTTFMSKIVEAKLLKRIEHYCVSEKDAGEREALLSKYYGDSAVIAKMVKDDESLKLLAFAETMEGNQRRYFIQRLFGNQNLVQGLLKAKQAERLLKLIRETPDRYQRTSLFSSLISTNNLDAFADNDSFPLLFELVQTETDSYAQRQMTYYMLSRSGTTAKIVQAGQFESLLLMVEGLDDRNRADMLLRMVTQTDARKELVKAKRLDDVIDKGMNGSTIEARKAFEERLFGNTSAINALVDEGYLVDLERALLKTDQAKRPTYQNNLYTQPATVKLLIEQQRLQMLLELAINQPNESFGTNLFTRIIGNQSAIENLEKEGRFEDLLQIAEQCSDPTQRGYRYVSMLSSSAMLDRLDAEQQVKPLLRSVLNSQVKNVRTRFLTALSNSTLAKLVVSLDVVDEALEHAKKDLSGATQRRALCSFLATPTLLAKKDGGKYVDQLLEQLDLETNTYNRSNIISSLANNNSMPSVIKTGRVEGLLKIIDRETSDSRRAYMYQNAFFSDSSLAALVETKQTKTLTKHIVDTINDTLRQYFLSAFSNNTSMQKHLRDSAIARCYFELIKDEPSESQRAYYVRALAKVPEAIAALSGEQAGLSMIEECLKLLPKENEDVLDDLLYGAGGIISQMLEQNQTDQAIALGQKHLSTDLSMLRYASLLATTGRLDAALEELKKGAESTPESSRLRIYLERAAGNAATALELAVELDDPGLTKTLAVEALEWKLAAKLQSAAQAPELPIAIKRSASPHAEIERLGLLAAYQQLAGDRDAADKTLDVIVQQQAEKPNDGELAWQAAQAMFLNSRFETGLAMLAPVNSPADKDAAATNTSRLFSMRMYRQEYEAALALYDTSDPLAFIRQRGEGGTALRIASMHESWGEHDAAQLIYRAYEAFAEEQSGSTQKNTLAALLSHYFRHGLREDAFRIADELKDTRVAITACFRTTSSASTQYTEANAWFKLLQEERPEAPASELIKIIDRVVNGPFTKEDGKWFVPLAKGALKRLSEDKDSSAVLLNGIASTCRRRGEPELARRAGEAALEKSNTMSLPLAKLLFAQEEWAKAAEQFEAHYEETSSETTKLGSWYLSGYCLAKSGEKESGQQRMQEAVWNSLQSRARHSLARFLLDHDLVDEAKPHLQHVLRTAPPEHWEHNDCHRLMGIHTPDDFAASAVHWRTYTLGNLRTNFTFNQTNSYLSIPLLTHKLSIIAAAKSGDVERAKLEATLCQDASLASTNPIEHLAKQLQDLGRQDVIDQLFERAFKHYSERAAKHEQSALLHNNLAWLCAMADKQLDLALQHAERAVALEPERGGYIDTLAEVHFRRGNPEKAVELEEKAVLLDPENDNLKKQLARFRGE